MAFTVGFGFREREHWSWMVHGHLIPEGVSIALGMVVVVIAVYTHTGSS
jgi:hypothetical protein